MADRIAQNPAGEPEDPNLQDVDEAFDRILVGIQTITEKLPQVQVSGDEEEAARKTIIDTLETAINPHFADMLEAFEVFEGKEE